MKEKLGKSLEERWPLSSSSLALCQWNPSTRCQCPLGQRKTLAPNGNRAGGSPWLSGQLYRRKFLKSIPGPQQKQPVTTAFVGKRHRTNIALDTKPNQ